MCSDDVRDGDGTTAGGGASRAFAPASVAEALRMAGAAAKYLNSPAADELETAALGEVLTTLGDLQAKLAAVQVTLLHRFDAADAHDADGYGSSSAWLAAKGQMTKRDALAAVRQMRQYSQRPGLHDAVAAGGMSKSWADAIIRWTRKLPEEMRADTDKIMLEAAAAGASLQDLQTIAAAAIEQWRSTRPDPADDFDFRDRHIRLGLTFGGAGVIRGDLTPECAAALTAVLEALGKKQGPEDDRNQGQRFHDALAEACHRLLRARLVPDRAGAGTQVVVHIPISQLRQMPGAADLEDAWLRARLGEPADPGTAYLTGKDAAAAACDALTVPVVTGHADMTAIDKIIALVPPVRPGSGEAYRALRYTIARLAADFVSGPGGLASVLRTGLLQRPYSMPSLPLDIGVSNSIPGHIRRAVMLRDQHCAWPGGCDRPASACDVHHIRHKSDGGETSIHNCGLFCEFHHEICIHRWGWEVILHPDGTMEARSPDGRQVLRKHDPPNQRAA